MGNVCGNQINPWVKFYEDVMGFRNILTYEENDISTESLRRQRRLEPDESMGEVLRGCDGFPEHPDLRPERYLDVIMASVPLVGTTGIHG